MIDASTGNVIVFNGEIYNYLEIKKSIGSTYAFKTNSDTEVILAAYKIYGIGFLEHLQGMFSMAIYDAMQDKVLCARDRFGIKPFYYRYIPQTFVFASEIKAIINLIDESESINSLKVYEFLANRQQDTNEETFFNGVTQLSPAHYMWVSTTGESEAPQCYWEYPSLGERKFDEGARKELVDLFDQTIQYHLRSDVTVGGFLSGGLDSSSIACFAVRNMSQESYPAFSAILPYHHAENVLIKEVLNANQKMVPHSFLLDGGDFFNDIRDVIYHHDEPVLDGSMYAHYKLCQLAKENGIKVLLSGSGGDELFGGYASHIHSYHATLLSSLRLKKYLTELGKVSRNSDHSYHTLLFKSVYENVSFNARRFLKNRQVQNKHRYLEIQPEIDHYYYETEDRYYANLLNYYKSWTVPPYLHYEDRNSMAFGIETRVPFYDHKLLEFVFQFSPGEVINGSSKSLMRDSFKGIVPQKVLRQKGKYGFPSPIDHALRSDKKGRELFFDLYRKAPFLKHKETREVGEDFYKGKGELTTYWRLLSYILWYDIFFDGRREASSK